MRKLSPTFLHCLKSDFLSEITEYVRGDHDLSLEIRDSYINVYYKGNSLLKLCEAGSLLHYKAEIDPKFLEGLQICLDLTKDTTPGFVKNIPFIKQNIARYGRRSLEIEYEQMLIRANNFERHNNTEYFIVDRQYVVKRDRFDLTGIHWKTNGRKRKQEVPVCLIEIKFALNPDIQNVYRQLGRYYEAIKTNAAGIAKELECVFRQKLTLGLYDQRQERLDAMKTLTFSRDIKDFQFILVLVDYNPNSTLFVLENLGGLPFADQIKIFRTGFGMWSHNVNPVSFDGHMKAMIRSNGRH